MNEEENNNLEQTYLDLASFEALITRITTATEPNETFSAVQEIRESYGSLFVEAERAMKETEELTSKYIGALQTMADLSNKLRLTPIEVAEALDEEVIDGVEQLIEDEEEDIEEDFSDAFSL